MAEYEDQLKRIAPELKKMLEELQYGQITLVVQDGKVIQLEKNEKVRIR